MKKLTCLLLSAVLALGTLTLFAGCGKQEITDEAKKAEVLSAFEKTQLSMFEMELATNTEAKQTTSDVSAKMTAKQTVNVVAYEEDGLTYGDMLMNSSSRTEYETKNDKNVATSDTYAVSFARGDVSYSAEGRWEDTRARAGDFDTLIKEYRDTARLLTAEEIPSEFEGEDVSSYGSFGLLADSKVYSVNGGYRVEYDIVAALAKVFEKLESGAAYFKEHPYCTLGELFAAADMEGYAGVAFFGEDADEKTARSVFGDPAAFAATVKRAKEDPATFLMESLFGYRAAEGNKGSFTYTLSADLGSDYSFKSLTLKLKTSMEQTSDSGEDKTTAKVEIALEVKALTEKPALYDLTGMRANLGIYPTVSTYTLITYDEYGCYLYGTGNSIHGKLTGKIDVNEDGTADFTLTFTEDETGDKVSATETWTVDLLSIPRYESEWHVFFMEFMGEEHYGFRLDVEAYDGYYIVYCDNFDYCNLQCADRVVYL